MGIDGLQGLDDERPRHAVFLNAYAMDLYEVTVGHYAAFLRQAARTPPLFWDTVDLNEHADRPVIGVDWADADAYCRWAGKRLPTEAEWEHAARGTDERRYPWGNETPTSELANYAIGARFSYSQTLMPVGHYEHGTSPYGMYDMAGNVWEWTSSLFKSYPYNATDGREDLKALGERIARGGSWHVFGGNSGNVRVDTRLKLDPNYFGAYVGIRCAASSK